MAYKKLFNVLSGHCESSPPIWFMRQAGRYLPEYQKLRQQKENFIEFCHDSHLTVEATLQPLKRFDLDAAIIFSDILLIPRALGSEVSFTEKQGPSLSPYQRCDFHEDSFSHQLEVVYESLERVKSQLPPHQALLGFIGAPWTLAAYMIEGHTSRDFLNARLWSLTHPNDFSHLMNVLIEACSCHAIGQLKAGSDAIQIFDSWAGCLPESLFHDYCLTPMKEIIRRIKKSVPNAKVIVFAKGCGVSHQSLAMHSGADGVSCDSTMPPSWLADHVQPYAAVQGTLDPADLVIGGKRMMAQTQKMLDTLGNGCYIFNCGHGILPVTPPDHIEQLIGFIRSYDL